MDRSIDGLFKKIWFVSVILVLMSAGSAGAVTPVTGCGALSTPGETYVLQNDISTSGTCITIDADNIILDGAGYSITGSGSGSGVYLNGRSGVTVKRLTRSTVLISVSTSTLPAATTSKTILSRTTMEMGSL